MLVVVPGLVSQTTADVTVAQFLDPQPPPVFELSVLDTDGRLVRREPVTGFRRISGGQGVPVFVTALSLEGLQPGARFELRLDETNGQTLTTAHVETLPTRLPPHPEGVEGARPFNLWVSSCFHHANATEGLKEAISSLLEDSRLRPHLKFHLGDQVYLDAPRAWWLTASLRSLQDRFNQTYAKTWTHPAFSRLLSHGANVLMSDDHEFWNNYPGELFPLVTQLRGSGFWRAWRKFAIERYELIQRGARTARIDIGSHGPPHLSLFAVDSRIDRTISSARFMSSEAMDEVVDWLQNLKCPGVLALSQPLLNFPGPASDTTIPSFRQFRDPFLKALRTCAVDLVVLAGDVHFGRVATTTLNPSKGTRLIEVVASPLALVNDVARAIGGKQTAPRRFPPFGPVADRTPIDYVQFVATYAPKRVWSGSEYRSEEHGMLLSFHAIGENRVGLRVRPHYVRANTPARPWTWETTLQGVTADTRDLVAG